MELLLPVFTTYCFNVTVCCFSTNCIFWIKTMNILLLVHPHSTAFKNVIAFYYYIIPIHTNVQWRRFSVHLPAETSRVAILNVKPQVYLNKTCTTTFWRRGCGFETKWHECLNNNITCISCRWYERGVTTAGLHLQILHSQISWWINGVSKAKQMISTVNQITTFSMPCERGNNHRTRLP